MPDTPRILLVDDDPDLLRMLHYVLTHSGYQVEQALDGQSALELARATHPQVVITDLMMPGMDGTALCRALKADPNLHPIYVVMLTAKSGSEIQINNLQVGADDYMVKPALLPELRARIQVGVRWVEAQAQLQKMATSDSLTGLPNRYLLNEVLARTMRQALNDKTPLSLILLDLDRFKRINDRYGHAVGDLALQQLADIIRSQVRSTDIPARYGGEEFVIVLPGVDQVLALRIAGRLRATVATRLWPAVVGAAAGLSSAHLPPVVQGGLPDTIRLTASIGVASLQELDVRTPEEFLKAADAASYRSKQTGRNRVSRVPALSSDRRYLDTAPDEAGANPDEELKRLVAAIEWFNSDLSPRHPPLPGHLLQMMQAQAVGWMRWPAPLHQGGHASGTHCLIASAGVSTEDALKISQHLSWESAPPVPDECSSSPVCQSLDGLAVLAGDRRLETALAMAAVDSEGELTGGIWVAWDHPVTPSSSQCFILARMAGALGLELEIERFKHGDPVPAEAPLSR